jgi:hypothetical protein
MAELSKEEFKQMYEKHKAKESVIKKDLDKFESERVVLRESVKKRIESLS